MSDERVIDLEKWVEKARQDQVQYLERQATEIVLTAIGGSPELGKKLFLKGGILMGVAYGSPRQTADLDFSTSLPVTEDVGERIKQALDLELPRVAARLGLPQLICAVQSIKQKPTSKRFLKFDFPALEVKIGYALRGTQQEKKLRARKASMVIDVEISFNEPLDSVEIVKLDSDGMLGVYSLYDLFAEKFRALLQQEIRDRHRRQDVYDIAHLLKHFKLNQEECTKILKNFIKKCEAREIFPAVDSIDSQELKRRAKEDWNSMNLELDELPDFEHCFEDVRAFYKSWPWSKV